MGTGSLLDRDTTGQLRLRDKQRTQRVRAMICQSFRFSPQLWRDIWAALPPKMSDDALRAVWDLMTQHKRHTYPTWHEHVAFVQNKSVADQRADSACAWVEIATLLLDRMPDLTAKRSGIEKRMNRASLDAVKEEILSRQWDTNPRQSQNFDAWRQVISDFCRM